jgi:hypothetical protein
MVKKAVSNKKKVKAKPRASVKQSGALTDPRVRAWDMLLRDPCAANLASPCYAGMDSGYLVRTVDNFTPTANAPLGTIGVAAIGDACFQFTPFNISSSTGALYTGITGGGTLPNAANQGFPGNFVTNIATVKRYRPVACCCKWIPTGQYSSRTGLIGLGYSTGQAIVSGDSMVIGDFISECQQHASNGSGAHEVRWLPTAVDENFTDVASASNTAAGSVFIALRNVDALYNSTTTIAFNGYIEITTVYEWVPSRNRGVTVAPKAPLPYTSQQLLSTIGDLGQYVFNGVRAMGNGNIVAGAQMGMRLLTHGYGGTKQRPSSFPLLTY